MKRPTLRAGVSHGHACLIVLLAIVATGCDWFTTSRTPDERVIHEVSFEGGHVLRYWQVAEHRVSRTDFAYEFSATLESDTERTTLLLVQLMSNDPASVPTDASVRFEPGPAGAETTATDTFTLRQDRRSAFDPEQLQFRLLDQYGGDLAVSVAATGHFRMDVIDGRHWFITPDGHPFWSAALNNITWHGDYSPPIDRRPYHEAVLAKYGDESGWASATEERMRGWGINTVGAWSNDGSWPSLPYTPMMGLAGAAPAVPGWPTGQTGKAIRDYFDPAFEANIASRTGRAVECAANPFCVGVYSDNEMPFGRSVLQFGTHVDAYLTLPAGAPGKLELQAFFADRYGDDIAAFNVAWSLELTSFDDIQALTSLEADSEFCNESGRRTDRQAFVAHVTARYFEVADAAIETAAPGVLFLGTRFLAVYTAPAIYEAAAPFVDVITINDYDWDENGRGLFKSEGEPYGYLFLDDTVSDLDTVHALTGKPMMITEWTIRTDRTDVDVLFPPFMPTARSQAERADRYEAFTRALVERPYMVGSHWFKFHDQPATGRGDGENSKFGVVDIEDEPYAELVERMAYMNARLHEPTSPMPSTALAAAAVSSEPLGQRRLSIAGPDPERSGFFIAILPGTNLANGITADDLLIDAGPADESGVAEIALAEDVVIAIEAVTGDIACFDLRAAGSFGELACDGGFAHDVRVTQATGVTDVSTVETEAYLGDDAGPGSATLRVPMRFVQLPAGSTPADCPAATAALEPALAAFTTATVTSTKGDATFDLAGEPFSCGPDGSLWRTEDGAGMWVVGVPLYDSRVPGGDLAAAFRFADRQLACRP